MKRARTALTLGILLAVAAALLLLGLWAPTPVGSGGDGRVDGGADDAESSLRPAPGLKTREDAALAGGDPTHRASDLPADVWTIEVAEVVGPDGKPVVGAEVFLDQARTLNRTWTWTGRPLRLRLRLRLRPWADDEQQRAEDERAGVVPCDDSPIYLSVRHDAFASWFAPPLRFRERTETKLRAVLGPRRTLRGVLLSQDGLRAPAHECMVVLRAAHVPGEMFRLEARVGGEDGRFAFLADDGIPTGPLVVEAYASWRFEDGLRVMQDVGPRDEEVVVTLQRAHRFRFAVTFAEETEVPDLAPRLVHWVPPAVAEPSAVVDDAYSAVAGGQGGDDAQEVLLPEGAVQTWRALVPGYDPFEVELVGGGRLEREVPILEAVPLQVTRRRRGGLMPDLHVRLTRGSVTRTWRQWWAARDLVDVSPVYLMLGEVGAGTWTIELLRAGKLLPWSERVDLVLGKLTSVRIPDEVVLPPEDR